MSRKSAWLLCIVMGGLGFCGCRPSVSPADSTEAFPSGKAPHGGNLVSLGAGECFLEAVFHPHEGMIHLYVLNREMDRYVRIQTPQLELMAKLPDRTERLVLKATENQVTGEVIGNSSLFEGAAEWLGGVRSVDTVLSRIQVGDRVYENVNLHLDPAKDDENGQDHTHQH